MNAWQMTQEEREALWAENDRLYRFADNDDPWDTARDMIEEKHRIEGQSLVGDYDDEWWEREMQSVRNRERAGQEAAYEVALEEEYDEHEDKTGWEYEFFTEFDK